MSNIVIGVVIMAAASVLFWYCMPRHGKMSPLMRYNVIDTLWPTLIVAGWTIGAGLIIFTLYSPIPG